MGQIKIHAEIGTHIDAPSYFVLLDTLIAPLVVINVHEETTTNYKISDDDIILFENKYGQIDKTQ